MFIGNNYIKSELVKKMYWNNNDKIYPCHIEFIDGTGSNWKSTPDDFQRALQDLREWELRGKNIIERKGGET